MTRNHRNAVAAVLSTTLLASPGVVSASAQAAGAKTMWFADSYATIEPATRS